MKRLLLSLLLAMGAATMHAQLLTIKSDLLMDAAMVPNLGAEIVTSSRASLGANVYSTLGNVYGQEIKLTGVMPQMRWWLQGTPMSRLFVGVAAAAVHYDMTLNKEGFKGDALGAGLTFGYAMPLSAHWNLDFNAGLGLFYYSHKHRWVADIKDTNSDHNVNGMKFMPMNLGVTLSYIWHYRNEKDWKRAK